MIIMIKDSEARKRCEAAICFARMYGVMETLEPMPFVENDAVAAQVLRWVEMYLDSGSGDMVQFFQEHCRNAWKNQQVNQHNQRRQEGGHGK